MTFREKKIWIRPTLLICRSCCGVVCGFQGHKTECMRFVCVGNRQSMWRYYLREVKLPLENSCDSMR